MKKVYIANIIGAPSPTAVIISEKPIDRIDWKQEALEIFNFLKSKHVIFSKLAIINLLSENIYNFKFVQIKNKNGVIKLESNANCGNAMVASARVVYMLAEMQKKNHNGILLTNVDTALKVLVVKKENYFDIKFYSLRGKSINSAKIFEGSEAVSISESFGNINVSIVDIVNPYIIIDAKELGIKTDTELLAIKDSDVEFLEKIKKIREDVITKYNFIQNSEFPKIAVVLNDKELTARTIYLDGWHTGLPITAAVSIAVTSKIKNSVIYSQEFKNKRILNPKGYKKIIIEINNEGVISECEVLDVKSEGSIDMYIYTDEKK